MKEEIATAAVKAAPPVAVSTAAVTGADIPYQEIVFILTIIYLAFQIIYTATKLVKENRKPAKRRSIKEQ